MRNGFIFLFVLLASVTMSAQQLIPLYDGPVPGSRDCEDQEYTGKWNGINILYKISKPAVAVYLPDRKNGELVAAVIICPGGGYGVNAWQHEGNEVAELFQKWGMAAFVVKYRLPDDGCMVDKKYAPLQDVQRAFQLVRSRAKEWGIDEKKVGVMGFSAGGHLASTAATQYHNPVLESFKPANLRPDFQILVYPVISMLPEIGHQGSADNLLGKDASRDLKVRFSSERNVPADAPPAFLIHASDDEVVNPDNSILYYQSLLRRKISASMHLYPKGGHGFGMNNPTSSDAWMDRLHAWLKDQMVLSK
ncbi:MAG: alpha/beta hydrolase [Bacteroidetes bacterium]|nr:alpha/beta hydrolase [Bacteroidota bacterium]